MKKFILRAIVLIILGGVAYNYLLKDDTVTYGITVDGVDIDIIDMHLHTGTWEALTEPYKERYSERVPKPFKFLMSGLLGSGLTSEGILKQMDNAGIRRGGVFAVYSPDTTGIASNEFLYEQIKDQPERMFGFYSIRTDHWNINADTELKKLESDLIKYNAHGIKLAHAHQRVAFDDGRYLGVYDVAATHGVPVLLHTGATPFPGACNEPKYYDPAELESVINAYNGENGNARVEFVLSHVGGVDQRATDHALSLAENYDNVWLEISALGGPMQIGPDGEPVDATEARYHYVLQEALARGLVGQTIFASDGPQSSGKVKAYLWEIIEAMQTAGFSADEMAAVLAGNFYRAYGLTPPQTSGR